MLFANCTFAETTVITGGVDFDWVNMSQIQRDEAISSYKNIMFGNETKFKIPKKEFKATYKEHLKDVNAKLNYTLLMNGVTKTDNAELCSFYYKNLLYMYAVKYNNNPSVVYYYNALGTLKYVDQLSENYPNFPYFSKQYRANGTLAGAIYFISKDLQYVYKSNGEFKGVWYKDKMFDNKANMILTRTNW